MGRSWSVSSIAGPLFFTSVALVMASGSMGDETLSPTKRKPAGSCYSTARAWTDGRPTAANPARRRLRMDASIRTAAVATC